MSDAEAVRFGPVPLAMTVVNLSRDCDRDNDRLGSLRVFTVGRPDHEPTEWEVSGRRGGEGDSHQIWRIHGR